MQPIFKPTPARGKTRYIQSTFMQVLSAYSHMSRGSWLRVEVLGMLDVEMCAWFGVKASVSRHGFFL